MCKQINSNQCLDNIKNIYNLKPYRKRLVLKRNSHLAKMAALKMKTNGVALVLGRTIHVYGVNPVSLLRDREWLAHELVHVKQYEKHGVIRFLCMYIWEWMKHGYWDNRYEREARQVENQPDSVTIFEEYDFEIK